MRRQIAFGWDCVPTNRGLRSKYETAKNLISIEKFNNLVLLGTASRSWNITVFVPYLEFTVKGKEGKRREGVVLCAAKMPLREKLVCFIFFVAMSRNMSRQVRQSFHMKQGVKKKRDMILLRKEEKPYFIFHSNLSSRGKRFTLGTSRTSEFFLFSKFFLTTCFIL